MKRPKKAKVFLKPITHMRASVTCPHCKTILETNIFRNILRISCYYCHESIDLIFPEETK
jgi:hypothetical protein